MMLRNSAARQGYRFLFNNTYGAAARTWSRSFAADAAAAPAVAASVDKVADQKPRHTRTRREFDLMNVYDAVAVCKQNCWAKFDESIDIAVQLGVDPRKPNQAIKGVAQLPHGNGKKVRVCVFATGDAANDALAAGADLVGGEELIADIQAGVMNFDTVVATPELMGVVGKVGRILGPRGMMPNPKMGTVTRDVSKAVRDAKGGAVKFKVEKQGIIHAGIGKRSFSDAALVENIKAFMLTVSQLKPENFKGKYLRRCSVSSSMGPGIELYLPSVDPGSPRFMINEPPPKQ